MTDDFCNNKKWKTTKKEDAKMEDDQNGRQPKWKMIKMEANQNQR